MEQLTPITLLTALQSSHCTALTVPTVLHCTYCTALTAFTALTPLTALHCTYCSHCTARTAYTATTALTELHLLQILHSLHCTALHLQHLLNLLHCNALRCTVFTAVTVLTAMHWTVRKFPQKISEVFWHLCPQRIIWALDKSPKKVSFICGNPMSESKFTWRILINLKQINMCFSINFLILCFLHSISLHIHFFVCSSIFQIFLHYVSSGDRTTVLVIARFTESLWKFQNRFYFSCETWEFQRN